MGRPGAGGGGGRSSGGHSGGSRSSGGHRMGGGSSGGGRPMGGGSRRGGGSRGRGFGGSHGGGGFFGGPGRDPFDGPPRRRRRGWFFGGPFHRGGYGGWGGLMGCAIAFVILYIIASVWFSSLFPSGNDSDAQTSTKNRTKIENPVAFQNDCITDETGYIEDASALSSELQYFYDKTGVQPYICMKAYDSSLTTDEEKVSYAEDWYEQNIDNEDTFLYMYFADADADEVGYMTYVNGTQVSSVMDAEAVEIFWNYIDRYWADGSLTMNEVFEKTFDATADTIMTKSKTKEDVSFMRYVVIAVIAIGVIVIILVRMKFKRDKEKNKETADILNAPLHTDDSDPLRDKYL